MKEIIPTILEELTEEESLWWLSFCDTDKPEGSQFLGVAIVRANGIATAITMTHMLKINPGGSVAGWGVPDDISIPDELQNRLVQKDELREAGLIA